MLCSFERLIYPRSPAEQSPSGYMVAAYRPQEKVLDGSGQALTNVKAVGYFLPTAPGIHFDLQGHWQRGKYGPQFEVTGFEEIIQPTQTGIVAYLSSGYIKGIGEKLAARIYARFGKETLNVLDKEPEKLLQIHGISEKKLKRIVLSYTESRAARDIITLLAPYNVSPKRAVQFFKIYGRDAVEIIREHPYRLCDVKGIGFHTADAIAKGVGINPLDSERLQAALLHTLKEAENGGVLFPNAGNLCVPKTTLLQKCTELLATPGLTGGMLAREYQSLLARNELVEYQGMCYRYITAEAEQRIAERVKELASYGTVSCKADLPGEIDEAEKRLGVKLASEQRRALETCLTSHISIITGGPGTGKTMLQRLILELYHVLRPEGKVICCAPTGRAARRMEQSTGHPASTIHRTLGLVTDPEATYQELDTLDADLVIVDEASMLDVYLAKQLLNALPFRCQLILVGDADQLPSVGPGAVLSDLIGCGRLPVVKLDKVYRQASGSRVAINAALIRHGNLALEYGEDFTLVEAKDFESAADILEQMYLNEVQNNGLDNVALLSPFRTKTETGVNALNLRLRDKLNPAAPDKPEAKYGKRVFRQGDRVMQIQNSGFVSNGDIGMVTAITKADDDLLVHVDFGDGRTMEYSHGELEALDHAYACTIHKSQGSEYDTVLISLQAAHYIMLKRPLLYTAITRAKKKAVIVGERKAVCMAIERLDTEKRSTMLSHRINAYLGKEPQYEQIAGLV